MITVVATAENTRSAVRDEETVPFRRRRGEGKILESDAQARHARAQPQLMERNAAKRGAVAAIGMQKRRTGAGKIGEALTQAVDTPGRLEHLVFIEAQQVMEGFQRRQAHHDVAFAQQAGQLDDLDLQAGTAEGADQGVGGQPRGSVASGNDHFFQRRFPCHD